MNMALVVLGLGGYPLRVVEAHQHHRWQRKSTKEDALALGILGYFLYLCNELLFNPSVGSLLHGYPADAPYLFSSLIPAIEVTK